MGKARFYQKEHKLTCKTAPSSLAAITVLSVGAPKPLFVYISDASPVPATFHIHLVYNFFFNAQLIMVIFYTQLLISHWSCFFFSIFSAPSPGPPSQ